MLDFVLSVLFFLLCGSVCRFWLAFLFFLSPFEIKAFLFLLVTKVKGYAHDCRTDSNAEARGLWLQPLHFQSSHISFMVFLWSLAHSSLKNNAIIIWCYVASWDAERLCMVFLWSLKLILPSKISVMWPRGMLKGCVWSSCGH